LAATTPRARQALGERLRDARRAATRTGAELAERVGGAWSQPRVSKIERGRQLPTREDVEQWARATGADPGGLADLLERATVEYGTLRSLYDAAGGAASFQGAVAAQEAAAQRIGKYQPNLIPGMLQTASYAHEMLRLPGGPVADEDELGRMIAGEVAPRRGPVRAGSAGDAAARGGRGADPCRL